MDLEITLHYGLSGLQELEQPWRALEAATDQPNHSHSYVWWRAYLETLAEEPDGFCFIAAHDANDTIAILPLVKKVRTAMGVFKAVVLESVHDPNFLFPDILVRPDQQNSAFFSTFTLALSKVMRWDLLVLGGVMGIMQHSHAVACLPADHPHLFLDEETGCFNLRMDDYEQFMQRIPRKDRANYRRYTKKVLALDDFKRESIEDPELIEQALKKFLDVEASGWKGFKGKGTAIKENPNMQQFYEKLAEAYSQEGKCQINLLSAEGHVIAGQFAIRLGNTIFLNKIGFNPDYSNYSPGNV